MKMPANEVFLDTSYAIALAAETDRHHQAAVTLAERLEVERTHIVTSRAVVIEIGNSLCRQRFRRAAVELLTALARDSRVEIVPLSEPLYTQAFQLFCDRLDKDWA
jgi:predicted nucleic acid-binding protein